MARSKVGYMTGTSALDQDLVPDIATLEGYASDVPLWLEEIRLTVDGACNISVNESAAIPLGANETFVLENFTVASLVIDTASITYSIVYIY